MTYPLEGIPLSEHDSVLRKAEVLGYTDAWSAEVNANDAFKLLAAFAAWTQKTRPGRGLQQSFIRTPPPLPRANRRPRGRPVLLGYRDELGGDRRELEGCSPRAATRAHAPDTCLPQGGVRRRDDVDDHRPL